MKWQKSYEDGLWPIEKIRIVKIIAYFSMSAPGLRPTARL